ncbi:MAG: CvpA family protein [Candidatus Marinimicrobia bacterium]|jgi:membrane protein required for colicin V production|nr:CvpA family protein [Candidatus Neomarinimicrobiota bacterium]MBT3944816.1 CvpA family protein [Candidatus Neomarinimicrobiota bacterium]MBT6797601.1 CvpA family protein [Candidatus Neomarinimicrobiota bacterium]MBT6867263.1 CvpA family protein [Candidatus Neomarinimicrobiota bacterium]MBT7042628.1 CvpA family protein [Candidatus Neomarinimicrobiota bacterium]|tara:strand:+ start:7221 stop:7748 length:528 start_codon:yes stop_codon:yes gene_type:complete
MSWFLDGLAILFVVLLGIVGFKRGFIEELGRLIGLIIAILISVSNSAKLSIKLNEILPSDQWMGLFLSFSLLFTATLIGARVLTKLVHIALLSRSNQLMNRSLGFLFGGIKGGFIVMVFIWVIAILPLKKWSIIIQENSQIAQRSNKLRLEMVTFFNWEDPVALSESYLKQLTQP